MNSLCEYCRFRFSWDCDDGQAYPKNGCNNFSLEWCTLSDEQRQIIKDSLISVLHREYNYYD